MVGKPFLMGTFAQPLCLALTAFIADVVLPQLNGASLIEKLGEIQLDPGQQHKRSRRVMTRL
jgi:hypothetical protein